MHKDIIVLFALRYGGLFWKCRRCGNQSNPHYKTKPEVRKLGLAHGRRCDWPDEIETWADVSGMNDERD